MTEGTSKTRISDGADAPPPGFRRELLFQLGFIPQRRAVGTAIGLPIQMGTSTKRILSVIIRNTVCENTERTLCLNS